LGRPWLAAGDRGLLSVLARMWHASFRRMPWLSDRFCWSLLRSVVVVRLQPRKQEHCQVRVDSVLAYVAWTDRMCCTLSVLWRENYDKLRQQRFT
jgi:hypothetical protein